MTPAGAAVRWLVALEHPILSCELVSEGGGPVEAEWTTDLRRAWPYPAGCCGDLQFSADTAGGRALVALAGDPFRLIVSVDGGTLTAEPAEGPAVRFTIRAAGRCRVHLIGAADEADLDRSRQVLARRQLAGLRRQRTDHARELAAYLTSIETPEATLGPAFERAKAQMDGCLTGTPGVGRALAAGGLAAPLRADRPAPAWYAGPAGCRVGMAQLAVGDRGAARDTLKFLSLTQDPAGRIVERCSTSGLALFDDSWSIPWYLLLASRYAAWTGELDFLAQRWAAIRRALDTGITARLWEGGAEVGARWAAALEAILPLAEALGHLEVAEEVAAHAAAAREGAGAATFDAEPGLVDFRAGRFAAGLDALRHSAAGDAQPSVVTTLAMEGLWGVAPDALEGAVRIAPWFPPDWDAMALERLRVGRTVLDVSLRRRFGQVAARIERAHGPRIHVEFELRGAPPGGTLHLDDVELPAGRVAFEGEGKHALIWHG
ncbi:MAG TPA: hypothetical protein VFV65_06310 [Gemmatimonadales bacterium]|nr:hypothetical protein [Gemmatimonadales bacterium]